MKCFVSFVVALLVAVPLYSQTPASINDGLLEKAQQRRDSLQRAFYSEPPYILVCYNRNKRRMPWSDKGIFFISQQGQRLDMHPVHGNAFLLPQLSADTIALGMEYAGRTICLLRIRASRLTHGGEVTFGTINRYFKRHRQDIKAQFKDEDSTSEETDVPYLYYDLIRDEQIKAHVEKQSGRGVLYQSFHPRVYGDGSSVTAYRVD
jgi:hypothetical protein